MAPVRWPCAFGARVFERHIGLRDRHYQAERLFSATPEQTDGWIEAWKMAQVLAGSYDGCRALAEEAERLRAYSAACSPRRRSRPAIRSSATTYFSPCRSRTGSSTADASAAASCSPHDIAADGPLLEDGAFLPSQRWAEAQALRASGQGPPQHRRDQARAGILRRVFAPLRRAEFRAHGGCVLIDWSIANTARKSWCSLPGQSHPYHFHRLKEETFQCCGAKCTSTSTARRSCCAATRCWCCLAPGTNFGPTPAV